MSTQWQEPDHIPSRAELRQAQGEGKSRVHPVLRLLKEAGIILLTAAVLSTLIRFFVVQVYSIPSESMYSTLQVGDRIAVNRLPYFGKQVERGDVVVFSDDNQWLPADPGMETVWIRIGQFMGIVPANGEEVLVKRVIGVGGDTVECCTLDGRLSVNGVAIDEPYLVEGAVASDQPFLVEVPEGTYWVMGDNRPRSADSRFHIDQGDSAFITEKAVLGKVWGVIWPFSDIGGVSNRKPFDAVP